MPQVVRGRLAPSPTGALHLGNARTFLWAWLSVRNAGGQMVLRVEDLEKRAQGLVLEEMLSDLAWLGFDWEEGPLWGSEEQRALNSGMNAQLRESGNKGPYIQSQRRDFYRGVFKILLEKNLIYPCICSKSHWQTPVSAPHEGEAGQRYPGICKDRFATLDQAQAARGPGDPLVWRFRVPDGLVEFIDGHFGPQRFNIQGLCGDFPVFKTPEEPYYQLAVVADDMAMGITEVTRGDDLLESTARQILLYQALEAQVPEFFHVPLVVGSDGKRVAKRHGDSRIRFYRDRGISPEEIIGQLARWSGIETGPLRPRDLIDRWSWADRPRQRVVLNPGDLGW